MMDAVIDYFPTGSRHDTNGWRLWTPTYGNTRAMTIWVNRASRADAYRTLVELIEAGSVTGRVTEHVKGSPLDPGWPFEK
jgi:hypothetical protein